MVEHESESGRIISRVEYVIVKRTWGDSTVRKSLDKKLKAEGFVKLGGC